MRRSELSRPDSIFKQPSFAARIFCGAGYAVFPFPLPAERRGDGAPSGAPVFRLAAPLVRGTRAPLGAPSRLFCPRGRSFRTRTGPSRPDPVGFRPPSSAPRPAHRRAVPRSRDGRLPGASRRQACEACPRAPHPLPPAMTPHESALVAEETMGTIIL